MRGRDKAGLTFVAAICLMFLGGTMTIARAQTLNVSVGETRIIMRGANYPSLLKLADGLIVASASRKSAPYPYDPGVNQKQIISTDGGRVWKDFSGTARMGGFGGSVCTLEDGTSLGLAYHTRPAEGKPDTFTTTRWVSTDNWKSVKASGPLYVQIPGVKPGVDDGGRPYHGPVFFGRSCALKDGGILATMYGKFGEDTKVKTSSSHRLRSVLIRSTDRGENWKYVSTIASLHGITDQKLLNSWQDGFGEPGLAVLPDGKLVCAMRTGTYVGMKTGESYHDLSQTIVRDGKYSVSNGQPTRPIYLATSSDGGKTWCKPRPVRPDARGACPRLLLLESGVLALAYGRLSRPSQGDSIIFSTDGGETWTNPTNIFPGLSSGYTDMVPIGPDKLLYVFDSVTAWGPKGAPDWIGAVDIEVKVK